MPGVDEMPRHGPAHDAEPDESDLRHIRSPLNLPEGQATAARASQPSPSTVVVFGLYSQPIQPS